MTTKTQSTPFATLPALGEPLDGGIFAGVITRTDGAHCAVVRLPENGTKLTWKKAITWATKQGGELPTRPVAALLFANVKASMPSGWHWTSEEFDASSAWICGFGYGHQNDLGLIRSLLDFATGGLKPDLTLLLDIDPAEGLMRRQKNGGEWNRLDAYQLQYHQRVRQGYLEMAQADPQRWQVIDASQTPDMVQSRIQKVLLSYLSSFSK